MTDNSRWVWFALLGALFAAVTQVLSKPAADRLGPNVVSLVRALVMLVAFVGVVLYESRFPGSTGGGATVDGSPVPPATPAHRGWPVGRPALYAIAMAGGVAASLSWFFGYKALRLADVSRTYPMDKLSVAFAVVLAVIFLGDRPSLINWTGIAVMIGGALLVTHKA